MGVGEATAYVDGKVVVKAELTFMVGWFFIRISLKEDR